jgi:hypothetical protein
MSGRITNLDDLGVVGQPGIARAGEAVRAMPSFPAAPLYTPSMTPAAHPLAAPTISGTLITVDLMLQQPTRITQMIMDLTLQRFIADRVFSSPGGVSGGAVVYDQATLNQLYTSRDVEKVAPGAEFPLITSPRLRPRVAEVEKYGGKVFITDEARDRNDVTAFTNQMRQLSNVMVLKINRIAVGVLNAAVTEYAQTVVGRNWQAVVTAGTTASSASQYPARDFAYAQQIADQQELGVKFDLWILNPQELAQLITIYGSANLQALLASMGIDLYSTNRQVAGTATVVASGQVGEMRLEKPLGTETWREPEEEKTFVQSSVRPVMYVTNPFSVIQFTGLAG